MFDEHDAHISEAASAEYIELEEFDGGDSGIVYFVENVKFPDTLKIGFTTRATAERISSWCGQWFRPEDFKIHFEIHVEPHEAQPLEAALHRLLSQYRLHSNRELFEVDLLKAVATTIRHLEEVNMEFRVTANTTEGCEVRDRLERPLILARRARLERELEQLNSRLGALPEAEVEVEVEAEPKAEPEPWRLAQPKAVIPVGPSFSNLLEGMSPLKRIAFGSLIAFILGLMGLGAGTDPHPLVAVVAITSGITLLVTSSGLLFVAVVNAVTAFFKAIFGNSIPSGIEKFRDHGFSLDFYLAFGGIVVLFVAILVNLS